MALATGTTQPSADLFKSILTIYPATLSARDLDLCASSLVSGLQCVLYKIFDIIIITLFLICILQMVVTLPLCMQWPLYPQCADSSCQWPRLGLGSVRKTSSRNSLQWSYIDRLNIFGLLDGRHNIGRAAI